MRIGFGTQEINNKKYPSFKMAKLTQKGTEIAQTFKPHLAKYGDYYAYGKKNHIVKVLQNVTKDKVDIDSIDDFFSLGMTRFSYNNSQFVKKQITPMRAKRAIRSFFKKEFTNDELSEKGKALYKSLLALFDENISNEKVSRKKGLTILNLIKPYATAEEISPRVAVVSDKLYSK